MNRSAARIGALVAIVAVCVALVFGARSLLGGDEKDRDLVLTAALAETLRVEANLIPARVGATELHLYFVDPTTLTPDLSQVRATFSQSGVSVAADLIAITPTHYVSSGLQLPNDGIWTLSLDAVHNGSAKLSTSWPVDVGD